MAIVITPLDLYRAGNKSGPRLDHFRSAEILVEARNGVDWVLGPRRGGASTMDAPVGLSETWYRLPQGTIYDDAVFFLWNDYPGHWSWEPAQDLRLAAYLDALRALNQKFLRN